MLQVQYETYSTRRNIAAAYSLTRINSAGALLAGRGQYSTVKNGTRMRYGSAFGILISAAVVQMGGILLVLVVVLVAMYWDRGRGRVK